MERAKLDPKEVEEVILGQILTAGAGQNPARQASIGAGIPVESPAWGVNQLCGSGLAGGCARPAADHQRRCQDRRGRRPGVDEPAPHCQHLRDGVKMGDYKLIDTMIKDGLWDAFNGYHMGNDCRERRQQWQITREEQDSFAVSSQNKAEAAQVGGKFKDEIVPGHHRDAQRQYRW